MVAMVAGSGDFVYVCIIHTYIASWVNANRVLWNANRVLRVLQGRIVSGGCVSRLGGGIASWGQKGVRHFVLVIVFFSAVINRGVWGVGKRITYKHQVRILAGFLAGGGCWAQL